ncbi:HAD family acid phosphatase [Sphingomonas sp. BAUL-RG-20F-R05-02]|uniref:HAD family acid phosphatase n=1 Tax=Sphingomonas sp. BAUL-RG-20F-R05-02 TaxID=2914830 RepID=UPI001F5A711E|nr:HAD family acid phosphatase [Sphingomonas sp. BAUL-RG-20F-R05-02]
MKRLPALLPTAFLLLQGFAAVPVTANDMGSRDDARLAGRSENGTDHAVYWSSSDAAPVIQAAYARPDTASPTGHVAMVQPITVAMTDTPSRLSRRRDRRATPGGRREALLTPSRSIAVPAGEQYLYGSGEAAAAYIQTYNALETYLLGIAADRAIGRDVRSVVLAPGATLQKPAFLPCDQKPMAVVFDIDETVVLNLGFEQASLAAGGGYSAERWDAWEKSGSRAVSLVPGVQDAIKVARDAHVEVIFNSNRSGANADETAAMLNGLGVGPVAYGKNLWLKGDGGSTGNGKDTRRQDISVHHCVIAMVGDQLGDFSDLFNARDLTIAARRQLPAGREIRLLWGHGWFMLPNPVYGTALKGTPAEIFPADKRWTPGSAPLPDPATTESK